MSISIIIVNFNTKRLLRSCLESINKNTDNFEPEIVVIDNNSEDGSIEMIKSDFTDIKLIANNSNVGFGQANNQGAKMAQGEYLLFLNSDTEMTDDFLKKLQENVNDLKNKGVMGFKIMNRNGSLQNFCGNFPSLLNLLMESIYLDRLLKGSSKLFYRVLNTKFYQQQQKFDWLSGSCLLISMDLFKKIGGFDEKYFLYIEDVDLCYKAKRQGYDNFYLPLKAVTHFNRSSSPNKTPAIVFSHQNLIYFFRKNHSNILAQLLKLLFIIKSILYSIIGTVFGVLFPRLFAQAKSYFILLTTLISKKKFTQYENSFKK